MNDRPRDLTPQDDTLPVAHQGLDRFWHLIGQQLRHPSGLSGSLAGRLMAIVNDQPNRLAIDALRPGPNDTILELGFGPGRALRALAARATGSRLFGIDQSDRMLRQATRLNRAAIAAGRMQLQCGRFGPLPWPDATFNKILLVNVLYFFDAAGRDLAEVFRVLRPGGRLVVYVTARETMTKWPFSGPDTHRVFDAVELRFVLEVAGFATSGIEIKTLTLPFGVRGLVATAEKL